jgi:CRISPR-associated protein Cmr4
MIKRHLFTLYTHTPLHVGSGTSVDVVDLPIMRERITGFPVIPSSSLKGVLLQHAREFFEGGEHSRKKTIPEAAKILFGAVEGDGEKQKSNAGCVQIMEAKILAFPVRSLAGCFAWLTCPAVLERFNRDTKLAVPIPRPQKDKVIAGKDLIPNGYSQVVFEEYAMSLQETVTGKDVVDVANKLKKFSCDPFWQTELATRLAVVHDENFQHFVTTCTEIVPRIVVDPNTRTNENFWSQENVPCETIFYSVLTVLPPHRPSIESAVPNTLESANALLEELLPSSHESRGDSPILQIGGDETTGHGLCEIKREILS